MMNPSMRDLKNLIVTLMSSHQPRAPQCEQLALRRRGGFVLAQCTPQVRSSRVSRTGHNHSDKLPQGCTESDQVNFPAPDNSLKGDVVNLTAESQCVSGGG